MKIIKIDTANAPQPGGWYSQAFVVGNGLFCWSNSGMTRDTKLLVAFGDIVRADASGT